MTGVWIRDPDPVWPEGLNPDPANIWPDPKPDSSYIKTFNATCMMTNMSSMPTPSMRKGSRPCMLVKKKPSSWHRPYADPIPIPTDTIPTVEKYSVTCSLVEMTVFNSFFKILDAGEPLWRPFSLFLSNPLPHSHPRQVPSHPQHVPHRHLFWLRNLSYIIV